MEITIVSVEKTKDCLFAHFQTSFGNGRGLWCSDKHPKINSKYDVELEIEDDLRWGVEIKLSQEKKYRIDFENQCLTLQGKIEFLEKDGFIALRFDRSIILLTAKGKIIANPKDFITINAKSIKLFETGI